MIKINDYYKLNLSKVIWIKITDISSDKYFVDYQIYNSKNPIVFGKKIFDRGFFDSWEKTGELEELTEEEKLVFNLVNDNK
jgi:hypothetical protein